MATKNAENIYDEFEPRMISADDMHAVMSQLAALQEENNALKAGKTQEDNSAPNLLGGEPVAHHLHLTDGRVINNHGGIGTHYSETLPDGSERITRIREYYPVEEVHPSKAYA